MKKRFTIDGSDALEQRLHELGAAAAEGIRRIVPTTKLDGVILGGGYGRGEGGVLKTDFSDEPYNDLEFYVFLRGNRLLNERRYARALNDLGEQLSSSAGIHVEFKCDSIEGLQRSPISMFTYDLVAGHHVICGEPDFFCDCQHHLDAGTIPLSEATRLLFNRCSGLLLAREKLNRVARNHASRALSAEDADFIERNLAKAQLALGDAVLVVHGQYHWSCRERNRRLTRLSLSELPADFANIKNHHDAGTVFKLHPHRSVMQAEEFEQLLRELSNLAARLWLWLEGVRLQKPFFTARDYSLYRSNKCPESSPWRNFVLNVRTFGLKAVSDSFSWRYPRERLFNALSLLLWDPEGPAEPTVRGFLEKQLHTTASDWSGWVAAYKNVWPTYA